MRFHGSLGYEAKPKPNSTSAGKGILGCVKCLQQLSFYAHDMCIYNIQYTIYNIQNTIYNIQYTIYIYIYSYSFLYLDIGKGTLNPNPKPYLEVQALGGVEECSDAKPETLNPKP